MRLDPKARLALARRVLAEAQEAAEGARKATDRAATVEIRVTETGVAYARTELERAREAYAASVREDLAAADPEFARLSAVASATRAAAQNVENMLQNVKTLVGRHRGMRPFLQGPEAVGTMTARAAYAAAMHRMFLLDGNARAECKEALATLREAATDAEGELAAYLEAHAERFADPSADEDLEVAS